MYAVNRERVQNSQCVYLVNKMPKFDKLTEITKDKSRRNL